MLGFVTIGLLVAGMVFASLAEDLVNRETFSTLGPSVAICTLIGFSRVHLGVPFVTDGLAGWAVGGLWLEVCILGDLGSKIPNHDKRIFISSAQN